MHNKRLLSICALFVALIPFVGCKSNPPNPNQGFTITSLIETQNSVGGPGPYAPLPGTLVLGQYAPEPGDGSPGGSVTSYDAHTNIDGTYYVSNGIAPAHWNHEVWVPSECLIPTPPIYLRQSQLFPPMNEFESDGVWTENLEKLTWYCTQYTSSVPEASSRFAIAGSVPASVTLSGQEPFSTQYGPPIMYVYGGASGAPNLAATVTASSVNSGGATATFPLPSSLPQGGYFFVTENMGSAGNYEFNSWNLYSIASSQTIAGNPFGVAVGALTVNTNVCAPYMGCTSTTINETFPIVSLYSNNQVLIGNGPINVGLNPTAVLTYASPPESYTNSSISYGVAATITVTGAMRAVAANSGSNSISILDILHGTLLFNVTVGNQPVALAVSSDGSTAYVANYTDGTVTQVNLITGTVTATVAVGGQPTAISLTAAGTLWVGGAGFLTEMNASPMSVVATKPVANKSIVALGFSDSENQLVATTVDTSGNVYADEISPSTFAAGRSYTPLASSMISSLGTHLNRANTEVRAFTATLASSSLANANLVGAPPLVVQDGWAVVTATPTGFSITDITGHIVLVSETTPSPVTAIAVNSKLNVAYLVMPDSNILLTVPLPGTN